MLNDQELLDWIDENVAVIAAICEQYPPNTPVSTCPGWALGDLLAHVAPMLGGWYTTNLEASPGEFDFMQSLLSGPQVPNDHAERIGCLRHGAQVLRARASEVDLDAPVWAFGAVASARFWLQRAATETAVHRWDTEVVGPGGAPIGSVRSAESLDETIRIMWPALCELEVPEAVPMSSGFELPLHPVGIRATDSGRSWRLRQEGGVVDAIETSDLPATIAEGTGHDLVLYAWGRIGSEQLKITGSREVVDGWNIVQRFES